MWQLPCYQSLRRTVSFQLHKSSIFCLQVLIYLKESGLKPNFDAGLGHYITLIYSKSATTVSLEQFRRSVHTSFLLPLDRPLIRSANRVTFPSPGATGAKLPSVHRGLETKHGLAGSNVQVALVQGDYDYHHYMQVSLTQTILVTMDEAVNTSVLQDNFDDDGWGCAYRSLQTIVSWLRKQVFSS